MAEVAVEFVPRGVLEILLWQGAPSLSPLLPPLGITLNETYASPPPMTVKGSFAAVIIMIHLWPTCFQLCGHCISLVHPSGVCAI
jgi:hypothetical protein